MNNEMFVKIMNIKKGNNDELIEVIEMFKPLIRKYSKMIDGEDTEQDLKIFLINLLNKLKTAAKSEKSPQPTRNWLQGN